MNKSHYFIQSRWTINVWPYSEMGKIVVEEMRNVKCPKELMVQDKDKVFNIWIQRDGVLIKIS